MSQEYTTYEDDDTDFSTLDRGDSYEDQDDEDQEDDIEIEEDEDEEEVEEPEEEEESEDEEIDEPKKDPKIPKGRLDKALRQRDEYKERSLWLEEQLEKLIEQGTRQQEKQAPKEPELPPYDFDTAEEQYANLLIEGETTKAAKLRREIENARQSQLQALLAEIEERAIEKASKTSSAATEQSKFQSLIENYENKYPFLNSENDLYNEEAVDTVNTLLAGYVSKGMTKSEALKKAVDKVAPMFVKETKTTKTISKTREIEANKKVAKAIKSQPPKTRSSTSTTIDTSKLDISRMSEREFAKLTPKELRLLRGD